jgi:hypothetical protein
MSQSPEDKTTAKTAAKAAEKAGAEEVGVFAGNSLIRTYSAEIHGEDFTKLAEEFAAQDLKREVRKIR